MGRRGVAGTGHSWFLAPTSMSLRCVTASSEADHGALTDRSANELPGVGLRAPGRWRRTGAGPVPVDQRRRDSGTGREPVVGGPRAGMRGRDWAWLVLGLVLGLGARWWLTGEELLPSTFR